ncbi:MAG TPA: phage tail protein [Roseomonas sp.]|nr:phage tail protein [Roseomonas sp.]
MDANGLRLWAFQERRDWRLDETMHDLRYQAGRKLLTLASRQPAPALAEDGTRARMLARQPSVVRDGQGGWAFWNSADSTLRAAGAGQGSVPITVPPDTPPGVAAPLDLAFGTDEVLYIARNGAIVMLDRRERWKPARVAAPDFFAHRLAPAPGGGVFALDATRGLLARLVGQPLRDGPYLPKNSDVFVPVEPNPDPPRLRVWNHHPLPAGHEAIALACSPEGQVTVLAWRAGAEAVLFLWRDGRFQPQAALTGLRFPYALAFLAESRVAVLATDGAGLARQVFAYDIDGPPAASALPAGDVYPLVSPWDAGFANAPGLPPHYPVFSLGPAPGDAPRPPEPAGLRPLHRLSRAAFARSGSMMLGPLDGGMSGIVWHRLYLEASLPEHAGVRVWLHASDTAERPVAPGEANAPSWHLHAFGVPALIEGFRDVPLGVWTDSASELPFQPALLPCPPEAGRSGLFTALVHRAGHRVRRIAGRYLWLHVELLGDTLSTPEVAALRVHGGRFSYRDRYLPALYHESSFGADADALGRATAPDFLERFLSIFEGSLTQLEDRVAQSWLLTDPATTPSPALAWLGQWIGLALDAQPDDERRRQILLAAPFTARLHGTLGGLLAALELSSGGVLVRGGRIDVEGVVPRPGQIALAAVNDTVAKALVLSVSEPGTGGETLVLMGGGVTGGEIVAVEGFRMRRTFSTILGADLADTTNPLTLGLSASGNSFVGDTLFLGDEAERGVLALFSAGLQLDPRDREAVTRFLDTLAYRVMVLVHDSVVPQDLGRLRRTAEAASPAHVEVSVVQATQPLIVGATSLVGVDTYLVDKAPPGTVTLDRSWLGVRDLVTGRGLLDMRGEAPASARPIAVADGPAAIPPGQGFLLSGLRSAAAPGRRVSRYIWMGR